MHNRALAQIGARVYTRRAMSGAAGSQWRAAGSMAGFFFFSYRATGMGNLLNSEGR